MPLTAAIVLALASQCSASVAPETMVSLARVESGFDPLAIGVNGPSPARLRAKSVTEAVDQANRLIAAGTNLDLGLAQINVANLRQLGLTVADAFVPCKNLHAAGQILKEAYQGQAPTIGQEQAALRRALSIYNTGRADRGFRNGYVAKVSAAAGALMTKLGTPQPSTPPAPSWDVFGRTGAHLVFTSNTTGETQ